MMMEIDANKKQDLIELTVNRVVDYFGDENHRCYLLADETGIGKTIEAREIIRKMSDGKDSFKVLYIASNLLLAKENIVKLKFKDNVDTIEIVKEDRISTYKKEEGSEKPIKYFPVTPAVSFYLHGGKSGEIKDCQSRYDEKWKDEEKKDDTINNIVKRIEQIKKGIEDLERDLKIKCPNEEKDKNEICKTCAIEDKKMCRSIKEYVFDNKMDVEVKDAGADEKVIQKAVFSSISSKKSLVQNVLKGLGTSYREYLMKKYKDPVEPEVGKENTIDFQIEEFKEELRTSVLPYFCTTGIDIFAGKFVENGDLISDFDSDEIVKIVKQAGAWLKSDAKQKLKNMENIDKFDYSPYKDFIRAYMLIGHKLQELDKIQKLEKDKQKVELNDSIIKFLEQSSEFKECIKRVLRIIYLKKRNQQFRLLGTLKGIEEYKPDLIILDEFQNYPRLFTNKPEDDNEDTQNLDKIMQAALKNEDSKAKVLMLSATPYAYQNMIDKSEGEEDVFLNHVGINDIISYMNDRNGKKVQFDEMYKGYMDSIDKLTQNPKSVKENDKDAPEKIAKEMSDVLYDLGISRNERPTAKYDSKENYGIGSVILDPKDIIDEEMVATAKKEEAMEIRRFLSTPIYFSENNVGEQTGTSETSDILSLNEELLKWHNGNDSKNIDIEKAEKRARAKALLKDIFPKEGFIPPLFIPSINGGELKGCFERYKYKDYSKKILFSAYTTVPELINAVVNKEFEKHIAVEGEDEKLFNNLKSISKDKFNTMDTYGCFIEYIDGCIEKIIKQNVSKQEAKYTEQAKVVNEITEKCDKIAEHLAGIFFADYAKKILIKVFREFDDEGNCIENKQGESSITCSNYWKKVVAYCQWGNFEAVLAEFFYLFFEEFKDGDIAEYLESVKAHSVFSQAYTSKSGIKESEMQEYRKAFQSPFYPMNFFLSSVAQEGLDFHWYCDFIIHWNVPANPIALLQREGRVNRYNCYSLRKQLHQELSEKNIIEGTDSWSCIFEKAEEVFNKNNDISRKLQENPYHSLYPHHISLSCEALPIQRKCYYYPLSEEHFRWIRLMKNMENYKSLLGAWNIEDYDSDISDEIKERLGKCMINISPGYYMKKEERISGRWKKKCRKRMLQKERKRSLKKKG